MYYLSVCAIVRNEADYIAEWISFNLLQGVQHFQIYDNGSTDDTTRILKPYMKAGIVRLHLWADVPGQFTAYNDCLRFMTDWPDEDSEWVAFIDCDEFLWSPKYPRVLDAVRHLDMKYGPRTGAIAAHWQLFGSNGHKEKTDGLVIERFTKRERNINNHVKSIVRRKDCVRVGNNPHTFRVNGRIIDERGMDLPVEYAIPDGGCADILRVNHYHLKSRAEYFKRKQENPDAGSGREYSLERIEEMFRVHDLNEVEDLSLLPYALKIKEKLSV